MRVIHTANGERLEVYRDGMNIVMQPKTLTYKNEWIYSGDPIAFPLDQIHNMAAVMLELAGEFK